MNNQTIQINYHPKYKERYFFILNDGTISNSIYENNDYDINRYKIGNCFSTKEKAQEKLNNIITYMELKRYAKEYNNDSLHWFNYDQKKYSIYYDIMLGWTEIVDQEFGRDMGGIYFTSRELAQQAIKDIGNERIKALFKED